MRYLTLAADHGDVMIRDEERGAVPAADLQLPEALIADIVTWNDRYQPVIPADEKERTAEPMASLIRELDRLGQQLAERISDAVDDDAKVQYFSEGLLRNMR